MEVKDLDLSVDNIENVLRRRGHQPVQNRALRRDLVRPSSDALSDEYFALLGKDSFRRVLRALVAEHGRPVVSRAARV